MTLLGAPGRRRCGYLLACRHTGSAPNFAPDLGGDAPQLRLRFPVRRATAALTVLLAVGALVSTAGCTASAGPALPAAPPDNTKACADWKAAFDQNTDSLGSVNVAGLTAGLHKASGEAQGGAAVENAMNLYVDEVGPYLKTPASDPDGIATSNLSAVQDDCTNERHPFAYNSRLTAMIAKQYGNGTAPSSTPDLAPNGQVTYTVTGSASSVMVTMQTPSGQTQQVGALTSYSYSFDPGNFLYISAQNQDASGTVTCTISEDGAVISTNTSDGGYTIASCQGTA